jgi:hypothetical protein
MGDVAGIRYTLVLSYIPPVATRVVLYVASMVPGNDARSTTHVILKVGGIPL